MSRLAILVSGRGTNMEIIYGKIESGDLPVDLTFIASDNPEAAALQKAQKAGVRIEVLPYHKVNRKAAEEHLARLIKETETEWIVLAGFMKILSSEFVRQHQGKIVNIHPSILPSFQGAKGIEDAWNYGVKITGVTVHLVDEEVDHGIILAQRPVIVEESDSIEDLEEKIHSVEHEIYWKTLKKLIEGNLVKIEGRRAFIG